MPPKSQSGPPNTSNPSDTSGTPRGILWGRVLLVAGLLAGLAAVAVVALVPQFRERLPGVFSPGTKGDGKGTGKDGEMGKGRPGYDAEALAEMRAQLRAWGKTPDKADDVVTLYFKELRFEPKEPVTTPVHPDEVFAALFVKTPPAPDSPAKLDEALAAVLKHLGAAPQTGAKGKELVAAVGRATASPVLVGSASFKAKFENREYVFPADTEGNREAREFALKLQGAPHPADDAVVKAARKAVRQLNGWKVQGVTEQDAGRRPAYVFRVYTHFLCTNSFDDKTLDHKDWRAGFVSRLPRTPAGADKDLGDEAAVRAALQVIGDRAGWLDGTGPTRFLDSFVSSIGDTLDYAKWFEETRPLGRYESNPAGLAPAVIVFADRFRPKAN